MPKMSVVVTVLHFSVTEKPDCFPFTAHANSLTFPAVAERRYRRQSTVSTSPLILGAGRSEKEQVGIGKAKTPQPGLRG
jgi:hypothetical protein